MRIRKNNYLRDCLAWLISWLYEPVLCLYGESKDTGRRRLDAIDCARLFISQAAPFVYLFLSIACTRVLAQSSLGDMIKSMTSAPVDLLAYNILPALADAGTLFSSAEVAADQMVELVDKRKELDVDGKVYAACGNAIRDLRGFVYLIRVIAISVAAVLGCSLKEESFGLLLTGFVPVLSVCVMALACFMVVEAGTMIDVEE